MKRAGEIMARKRGNKLSTPTTSNVGAGGAAEGGV